MIMSLNDITTKTQEGQMLLSAIGVLMSRTYPNLTPDEIIKELQKPMARMFKETLK